MLFERVVWKKFILPLKLRHHNMIVKLNYSYLCNVQAQSESIIWKVLWCQVYAVRVINLNVWFYFIFTCFSQVGPDKINMIEARALHYHTLEPQGKFKTWFLHFISNYSVFINSTLFIKIKIIVAIFKIS